MPGSPERREQQDSGGEVGVLHGSRVWPPGDLQVAEQLVGLGHETRLERHQEPPVVSGHAGDAEGPGQDGAGPPVSRGRLTPATGLGRPPSAPSPRWPPLVPSPADLVTFAVLRVAARPASVSGDTSRATYRLAGNCPIYLG